MAETSNLRRRIIQFVSMLIYNCDVRNFFSGTISKSGAKSFCVPGLNCYSCPGAVSSCPLGALQNSIANGKFPFFVTGFLLLTGTLLGRTVCSFLCPFGLFQELLYKIPLPKIKKSARTLKITRKASLIKYFMLIFFCVSLPFIFFIKDGLGSPYFCKLFCPGGTIFAGWFLAAFNETLRDSLGFLFTLKTSIAIYFIAWSMFMFRPFCRFFCPLGAIYSFFNKTAVFGIRVDQSKCTNCGACTLRCKMDVLKINDRECIRCGECRARCKFGAI